MKKYMEQIKKIFFSLRGRRDGYNRDHYYHHILDQYKDNSTYLSMYKSCISNKSLKTDVEICFSKLVRFGSDIKDIQRILGKPSYQIKNISSLNIEILVYRKLIGNHKVKCQMHLFENKLFMYTYTFRYVNKYENEQIMRIIQSKYVPGFVSYAYENIIDSLNNCLQIEKKVGITINYFSLTCDFFVKSILLTTTIEERLIKQNLAWHREIYERV